VVLFQSLIEFFEDFLKSYLSFRDKFVTIDPVTSECKRKQDKGVTMAKKVFIKTYRIKTGVIIREVASTRQGDNILPSTFQIDVLRNGKRIRETYDTKKEAKDRCQEIIDDIKADGVKLLALKDEKKHLEALKRMEAFPTEFAFSGARRLLDAFPSGTIQEDVIAAYTRLLNNRQSVSLVDVVKFWEAHHPEGVSMPTPQEALDEYLEHKRNRRGRTLHQIKFDVGRLVTYLNEQSVQVRIADVTKATVETYLKTKFPKSVLQQKKVSGILRTFFKFCCGKYGLPKNPAEGIILDIAARDESEVEAYTVQEVKKIMKAAINHELYSSATPSFAIGFFAGLRPTEVLGLDWKDVCFRSNRIRVSPQTAKRRRSRLVDMSPNLVEWLRPYEQANGPVVTSFMTYRRAKEEIFKGAKVKPIADGFRHSFGTYHLALHEDANQTANQMGHRGNTDLVFSHYRKLVPKEEGKAYFEITPATAQAVKD
jgi:integrase